MLRRMGDASLTTELGRVLVTGGSGFVGANLVTTLLERDTRCVPSTARRRRCPAPEARGAAG
ncbi:short chain dehydrogenase family protein [Mycobacterium kansasii]|uniref:Short chain dehydrogenase family protein n=1 Tax=Mycobacterium kansasii TaxID=1768 RepID=A0A1V3XLS1_MYCKA|nr:short chain dehydrogenase family protein [Mycobacterium kansasii]